MSSDFDAFLRVEDPTGKQIALDDDGGKGLNSKLVFAATKKGTYRIIATSLNGRPGDYTLTLTPKKVVFATSGILKKPTTTYNVKLEKGKTYKIDLTSPVFDTLMKINDAAGRQLATDDDGGDKLNSRLVFRAPNTATYQIDLIRF